MPSPGEAFLGLWSLLSPRPSIPSCGKGSGTWPQELGTHWATPVPLPVLPTPSLPCHNILPDFLLCQCSCQIGLLCPGRGPLIQRGPRSLGAAQIPCLCQRSLGSRHRGSISVLPFPTQHSLYLLSHTTPEVSRLPLSLLDPVCGKNSFILMQIGKKKNPVAVGAEARWASCLLTIPPPSPSPLPSP